MSLITRSRCLVLSLGDEARILGRLRAGESQAYDAFVSANAGRLMAVAQRILENEADAADAVQDGFLALFFFFGEGEGTASVHHALLRTRVRDTVLTSATIASSHALAAHSFECLVRIRLAASSSEKRKRRDTAS